MPDEADIERGRVAWRDVMGFEPPPVEDAYTEFTTELFDRVWQRPGLGHRERRFITMTVVALRGTRDPLVAHVGAAVRSGDVTPDELHEWVVHVAHYGGWPIAANAYGVVREVLASRDARPD